MRLADVWIERLASTSRAPAEVSSWIRRSGWANRATGRATGTPALHWQEAFRPVFHNEGGGFDAVLTNPPYRSALSVSSEAGRQRRRLLKALHPDFTRGAFDLSTVFWSRITRTLLRASGRYGAVVPTASLSSMAPWQDWMHQFWRPDVLLLYPVDCFVDARVRTTAVIGGGGSPATVWVDDQTGPEPARGSVCWNEVDGPWFAATRLHRAAPPPSRSTVPLAEHVQLSAGCTTDGAYRLADCLVDGVDADGLRLVTTGALDRFTCHWGRRPQRFLRRDLLHPRWPSHEGSTPLLRARDAQHAPKILVAGLTAVLEAWFDAAGTSAGVVQTWVLRPEPNLDPYVLVGVLNSAVFSQLYMGRYGGASMSGRQTTIKKRALGMMPLPEAALGTSQGTWEGGWKRLWDPGTTDQEVRSLLRRIAARLQQHPDKPERAPLEWLLHAVVARLYGYSPKEALASLSWFAERMRLPGWRPHWPLVQVEATLHRLGTV